MNLHDEINLENIWIGSCVLKVMFEKNIHQWLSRWQSFMDATKERNYMFKSLDGFEEIFVDLC